MRRPFQHGSGRVVWPPHRADKVTVCVVESVPNHPERHGWVLWARPRHLERVAVEILALVHKVGLALHKKIRAHYLGKVTVCGSIEGERRCGPKRTPLRPLVVLDRARWAVWSALLREYARQASCLREPFANRPKCLEEAVV